MKLIPIILSSALLLSCEEMIDKKPHKDQKPAIMVNERLCTDILYAINVIHRVIEQYGFVGGYIRADYAIAYDDLEHDYITNNCETTHGEFPGRLT